MALPQEVRIFREGTLRWVQSSGTGGGFNTSTTPATGLIGYVQAGFDFVQAKMYETISDRGTPKHHKLAAVEPGQATFTVLYGVTADYPPEVTSSGVSTPQIHLEFRMQTTELSTASATYFQLLNCVELSRKLTEEIAGDKYAFTFRYLSAIGPTGSGYLF